MDRVERTVFLSYRRTNFPWALAIYQNLTHHGFDVFFDYSGIASGDFEQVILGNITARAHFLVLLTPSALERCSEPGDWLRREIETAIESQRNIVPVMLEGFSFSTPSISDQLTGTLNALKNYNGLDIPPRYFDHGMGMLRNQYLNVPLSAVLHPASRTAKESATEQKVAANAAPQVQKQELTAQQWFERGYAATDPDEKVRCYSEAIRIKPDYATAFNNRGIALEDKGELDGAMRDYNEAIRLKPDYADALNNRSAARCDKGDLDGALQDANEAIRIKPNHAPAYTNRGRARQNKGDLEGAMRDYNEAIRIKPDFSIAFSNRSSLRCDKADLDGALQDANEAIRIKPDYAPAYNNRGRARHDKGDFEGAIRDYDETIRLKPDYANAFYNRGLARRKSASTSGEKSMYKAAIADYQKYLDLGGGLRDGDQSKVEQWISDLKKKL